MSFAADSLASIVPTRLKEPENPLTWGGWRKANYEFFREAFKDETGPITVVDIGSGQMHFKALYRAHRFIGVDIFPYPGVDVVCDASKGIPLGDGTADVVCLSNTLEHIENPRDLMANVKRILKPGGLVVGAVPFMLGEHQAPLDFQRFTSYGLRSLFESSGFCVERLVRWGDSLELLSEFGWKAFMSLERVGGIEGWAFKRLLAVLTRFVQWLRWRRGLSLLNSPLNDGCPHGFMFTLRVAWTKQI